MEPSEITAHWESQWNTWHLTVILGVTFAAQIPPAVNLLLVPIGVLLKTKQVENEADNNNQAKENLGQFFMVLINKYLFSIAATWPENWP